MLELSWPILKQFPKLKNNEAHVWSVSLQTTAERRAELWNLLNTKERERVERLRFVEHRERMIVSLGVLREILASYLHCQPNTLQFNIGEHGKPYLQQALHFNMTHSQDIALYAVSLEFEVGIDVEQFTKQVDPQAIAQRWFAESEYKEILAAPAVQQQKLFFDFWTCKEAVIKALGKGLSQPLNQFAVEKINTSAPHIIALPDADKYKLYQLEPANNYVGAIAIMGMVSTLHCWQWTHNH